MIEKRKFTRIIFSSPVTLSDGLRTWQSKLIDLSLKGALIEQPAEWQFNDEVDYTLSFFLGDSDIEVSMQVDIAHKHDNLLGLNCVKIEIESVSHLKRLVELNVGNDKLLHRELAELSHPTPM